MCGVHPHCVGSLFGFNMFITFGENEATLFAPAEMSTTSIASYSETIRVETDNERLAGDNRSSESRQKSDYVTTQFKCNIGAVPIVSKGF